MVEDRDDRGSPMKKLFVLCMYTLGMAGTVVGLVSLAFDILTYVISMLITLLLFVGFLCLLTMVSERQKSLVWKQ
jgi:hypothetical protein